jgi:hypothetical protein
LILTPKRCVVRVFVLAHLPVLNIHRSLPTAPTDMQRRSATYALGNSDFRIAALRSSRHQPQPRMRRPTNLVCMIDTIS